MDLIAIFFLIPFDIARYILKFGVNNFLQLLFFPNCKFSFKTFFLNCKFFFRCIGDSSKGFHLYTQISKGFIIRRTR